MAKKTYNCSKTFAYNNKIKHSDFTAAARLGSFTQFPQNCYFKAITKSMQCQIKVLVYYIPNLAAYSFFSFTLVVAKLFI